MAKVKKTVVVELPVSKANVEAGKELGRLVVLSILPVAVVELTKVNAIWALFGVAVLRAVEKYMYEKGKETGNMNRLSRALTFEVPKVY